MRSNPIKLLRWAGFIEGTTLLLLLCVAVPLKHVGGIPQATSVLGPIHGLTFVCYFVSAVNAVSGGSWRKPEIIRIVIAAVLPFGTFVNDRWLARKQWP